MTRDERIADIGRRAKALLAAGYYNRAEVAWLSQYVRGPSVDLVDVEWMLANAERLARGRNMGRPAS